MTNLYEAGKILEPQLGSSQCRFWLSEEDEIEIHFLQFVFFQRKKDEKEAEKNRKREQKKQKKQEKLQKKKEERVRKKEEEFRRKKMSKGSASKYFGQPLPNICPENSLVPLFITKCIDFVEASGEWWSLLGLH